MTEHPGKGSAVACLALGILSIATMLFGPGFH